MSEKVATGVPTVTVTLDKKRTLIGTLGSINRIQSHASDDLVKDDGSINEQAGLANLGTMVWCMLTKEARAELDVEDVEDLLHPGNIEEVSAACESLTKPWLDTGSAEGNGKAPAKRKKSAPK